MMKNFMFKYLDKENQDVIIKAMDIKDYKDKDFIIK